MLNAITDTEAVPVFYLNVNSKWFSGRVKILDLNFYTPYKEIGDTVICIFAYCGYLWRFFLKLPDILNGAGADYKSVTNFKASNSKNNSSKVRG